MNQNCKLIMGIDREIIERFLDLIKEKYPIVDKANYFLERQGASGINITMANQRDFLSHLCTVLSDHSLDRDQMLAQLSAAEEHLRRAVIECYQKAVTIKMTKVLQSVEEYKKHVIPLQNNPLFGSAPNNLSIRVQIEEIEQLRERGRSAKSRNKWDAEWEAGVDSLVDAFMKAKELGQELEDFLLRASQVRVSKKQTYLAVWGIIATIITFILGTFLYFKWK